MSFARLGLDRPVVDGLLRMGYRRPRPVQREVIPFFLEGRDVRAVAPTGTGKTMAFLAPLVHQLRESRPQGRRGSRAVRGLVLCPTRELAAQVADGAGDLVKGLHLTTLCVHGQASLRRQFDALAAGVDLLVATPGRLRDLLAEGALTLEAVHTVVIDEADRMLDMGFRPQVSRILDRVPLPRQIVLYTATMPTDVEALADELMTEPVRVETTVDGRTEGGGSLRTHVRRHVVAVHDRDKIALLLAILERRQPRGVIVFCRTRRRVGWVTAALRRHGARVGQIHGDRTQAQRTRDLTRLGAGTLDVLVATDVASRGLHVPTVDLVVSYDVPLDVEEYVHRTGRAGHGGARAGTAFTLLSQADRKPWSAIAGGLEESLEVEPASAHGGPEPRAVEPARPVQRTRTEGTKPTKTAAKSAAKPARRSESQARGQRRSKRSRPIAPDQVPGSGVRRGSTEPRAPKQRKKDE